MLMSYGLLTFRISVTMHFSFAEYQFGRFAFSYSVHNMKENSAEI